MEELELGSPGVEEVERWEQEYLSSLYEKDWLGEPRSSVELYVLDRSLTPEAESVSRLESRLSELHLLACFKDDLTGAVNKYMTDESFLQSLDDIHRRFERGIWDVSAYLDALYEAAPEEVDIEFYLQEAELETLPHLGVAYELEEALEQSGEFAFEGVRLEGNSESSTVEDAYRELENDLSLSVDFRYAGNEEAVEKFNEDVMRGREEYSGVPGTVFIGSEEKALAFIPTAPETGLSYREVEGELMNMLEPTVASKVDYRREKAG